MIKKLYLSVLTMMLFMFGIVSVDAKTYTSYSVGDKIEVKVNDNEKLEFYVVKDNQDKVDAIYTGSLGDEFKFLWEFGDSCSFTDTNISEELEKRTSNWDNVNNVKLPSADDIIAGFDYSSLDELDEMGAQTNPEGHGMIHLENLNDVPFYALNNSSGSKFFTDSLVIDKNGLNETCWIYAYGYALTDFPFLYVYSGEGDYSSTGNIRPMINVSKDYVVNGLKVDENDTLWEEFVDKFKKTETVEVYEEPDDNSVIIESTDKTLKVTLHSNGSNTVTNFTYDNGIVTYVPSNNDENLFVDSIWVYNCIETLSDLKGYDIEKVSGYLEQEKQFVLDKDGIEFAYKDVSIEGDSPFVDIGLSINAFSKFKLDIKNGLKKLSDYTIDDDNSDDGNENNQTNQNKPSDSVDKNGNVTKNPQTGGIIGFFVIMIITFMIAYFIVVRIVKHN